MNSHVVPGARDGNGVEAKSARPGSQSGRPLVAKRVLAVGAAPRSSGGKPPRIRQSSYCWR
jgi:hypothetical protein